MKKIILFLFLSCYVNAQDYSSLFNSLDSLQKNEAIYHLRKIKKLINYQILKEGNTIKENEYIEGTFFINTSGKFSLIILEGESKKYNQIITNIISNLPNSHCVKYYNEYASFKFKLNEINDLVNFYTELMQEEQNKPKAFSELTTYPSFEKTTFLNNKEKSLEFFQKKMAKHIKSNFRYPETAYENEIQGKIDIWFTITKEGNVNEIFACKAHPTLQFEGIRIMGLLPKFIPGTLDGENISVLYAQPLTFKMY